MNFCAKCGRERPGDARYCGGCGTEFAAAPAAAATASADDDSDGGDPQPSATVEAQAAPGPAEEAERWEPPADATRVERSPDVTIIDRPGGADSAPAAAPQPAEPDPFAAWFAPDAQAAPKTELGRQWQAAEPWQAADTVYAAPGQPTPDYAPSPSRPAPGYPPPRPPYGAQPTPPSGGRRSSGGRKAAFILVVVLVMLAAGGGAYALVSRSNGQTTAQPPVSPTSGSSAASTARSSASASTSPSGSPTAAASVSAPSGLVSLGAGVTSSGAEPAVEVTLSRYFQGINNHDYAEYQSAHNAQVQATEPQSAFKSGYGSTADSGMTLVSLDSTANGGVSATVTFTSHQSAGSSIDGSTCNNWQLTFFLVPQGTGYLIGAAPSTYKPIYSDC